MHPGFCSRGRPTRRSFQRHLTWCYATTADLASHRDLWREREHREVRARSAKLGQRFGARRSRGGGSRSNQSSR